MYELAQIRELRRELIADRIFSIRLRLAGIVFLLMFWVGQFQGIFNSMNIELATSTKVTLAVSAWLQDWWWIAIPLSWISWRVLEDRYLTSASPRSLRYLAAALVLVAVGLLLAVHMPMFKLINNVG